MFGDDVLFLQRFLKSFGYYEGRLDNDFGPLTAAGLAKFEDLTDQILAALGRFDLRSEKNIITLHPKAQIFARKFLMSVRCNDELQKSEVEVKIISGTRTYKEQAQLYAQGRAKPGRIITKASAGS